MGKQVQCKVMSMCLEQGKRWLYDGDEKRMERQRLTCDGRGGEQTSMMMVMVTVTVTVVVVVAVAVAIVAVVVVVIELCW